MIALVTISLGLGVLALSGCNVSNTYEAKDGNKGEPIKDKRVTWNWGLNWSVYVTGLYELKKPGELMRVDYEVNNRSLDPKTFRYKFEWFDANGMVVPGNDNWREGTVAAGEYKRFYGLAPTLQAVDFRLAMTYKQ